MHILYFATLRERVGRAEEEVSPPAHIVDAGQLVDWLKTRGPEFERAFADLRGVRIAVNQEHVRLDHPVEASDEIAFFPPVTGGNFDAGRAEMVGSAARPSSSPAGARPPHGARARPTEPSPSARGTGGDIH